MLKKSLVLRLLLINFLLLIVPTFAWLIYLFESTHTQSRAESLYHMQNLADSRSSKIEEHIRSSETILAMLASVYDLANPENLNQNDLTLELEKFIRAAPSFEHIFYSLKNNNGNFVIWASPTFTDLRDIDVTNRLFITSAVAEKATLTLGFGPKGKPYAFITKAVRNQNGEVTGALTIAYNPHALLERVLDVEYNSLDIHFALFTINGISFADDDPTFEMHSFNKLTPEEINSLTLQGVIEQSTIIYDPVKPVNIAPFSRVFEGERKGVKRLGLTWPIPDSNAMLIVALSEKALFTAFYTHLWQSLVIVAISCVFSSFIIWFLAYRLAKPMHQFLSLINQLEKNNLLTRFQKDEVGYEMNELGDSVNHMLDKLIIQIDAIREEPVKQQLAEKELKIAHQIQQQLLPNPLPVVERCFLATVAKPSLEVGGDFYDIGLVRQGSKKACFIVIADVAGKGISACLFSLSLRSMLRSYINSTHDISQTIQKANAMFCQDTLVTSMFATVFAGLFDPETLQLKYYSAGHLPALLRHKDGSIEKLCSSGIPLGVQPLTDIKEQSIQLQPEDILLLYTDGITEAMNSGGDCFGEEKLIKFMQKIPYSTPQETLNSLVKEVESHAQNAQQSDDITAILIHIN